MFQFAFGLEGLETISSEHLRTFSATFWTSSKNHRKSLEVAVTSSEIAVMTRRKSHTFDSKNVGRYVTISVLFT